MPRRPLVLKFGGELLEDRARLAAVVAAVAGMTGRPDARPLVIVHGGGKEIDADLKAAGLEKRQVDGIRVTDEPTLDIVVKVLAGAVNTRLVAALVNAGVSGVGLTGADGGCGLSEAAAPHRAAGGATVDLGRVGTPLQRSDTRLLTTLLDHRFVPVIASIGIGEDGRLFNVNADTLAGHLAARLGAWRLAIAGTTPGVLNAAGLTEPSLDEAAIEALVSNGTATAGMIAKLRACAGAIAAGVDDVVILDGRNRLAIEAAASDTAPQGATRIVGRNAQAAVGRR